MQVRSFIRRGHELATVEVELSLSPGLPQILFLGLPDTALKESALRIRSALREQGFRMPQAHQVLVHLKPTHLRKSSRGLDLAVAAALLWETGQIPKPEGTVQPTLYGELTLKGQVVRPDDLEEVEWKDDAPFYTGLGSRPLPFSSFALKDLQMLSEPKFVKGLKEEIEWQRPSPRAPTFTTRAAELAEVIAAGEHATLVAGNPGSGKSTLMDSVASWIEAPRPGDIRQIKQNDRILGQETRWRPIARPHHSITSLAMIGGGSNLWSGEITRAHGGVLILDEMLEFSVAIQDALREPVENGTISIARGGQSKTFPARILLLATTNLCPCGNLSPKERVSRCRCPKMVRRRSLSRLTGPFVDRFAIFSLTEDWNEKETKTVSSDEIQKRVERAIQFRQKARAQMLPNSWTIAEVIEKALDDFQRHQILDAQNFSSRRRRDSTLRVARTLADLRVSEKISNDDLERAVDLCVRTHRQLEARQD